MKNRNTLNPVLATNKNKCSFTRLCSARSKTSNKRVESGSQSHESLNFDDKLMNGPVFLDLFLNSFLVSEILAINITEKRRKNQILIIKPTNDLQFIILLLLKSDFLI